MKYPYAVKHNGKYYAAGEDVPVKVKVEVTDKVPEGALDTNPDGSVNAYDEDGNPAGTVDAETVKQLQEAAGQDIEKPDADKPKSKRGRPKAEE